MINIPNLDLTAQEQHKVSAKIIEIEEKFPWFNFFRKTKKYTFFINTEKLPEKVDFYVYGKGIYHRDPIEKGIFLDAKSLLEGKVIGDTIEVVVHIYSVLQQQNHGTPAMSFSFN